MLWVICLQLGNNFLQGFRQFRVLLINVFNKSLNVIFHLCHSFSLFGSSANAVICPTHGCKNADAARRLS